MATVTWTGEGNNIPPLPQPWYRRLWDWLRGVKPPPWGWNDPDNWTPRQPQDGDDVLVPAGSQVATIAGAEKVCLKSFTIGFANDPAIDRMTMVGGRCT